MGCSWLLLSSRCDQNRYYRVADGTGPVPNENQFSCRTLLACLAVMLYCTHGYPLLAILLRRAVSIACGFI